MKVALTVLIAIIVMIAKVAIIVMIAGIAKIATNAEIVKIAKIAKFAIDATIVKIAKIAINAIIAKIAKIEENIKPIKKVKKHFFIKKSLNKKYKIMKAKELIKMLEGYEDFDIELTVHRRLSDEVLKHLAYPYPYENINTELELDDIGYSDNVVCLGCKI